MQVLKKDGSLEDFFPAKIISAIQKAAFRCDRKLDAETLESMAETVRKRSEHEDKVSVATLHELVIAVLSSFGFKDVADSYAEYRYYRSNYAKTFEQLRQDDVRIHVGDLAGQRLVDVLVSDLMETAA